MRLNEAALILLFEEDDDTKISNSFELTLNSSTCYFNYKELYNMIKDSGNRTKFTTGAVRDIQKGKGRFDLMPLDAVAFVMDHSYMSNGFVEDDLAKAMNMIKSVHPDSLGRTNAILYYLADAIWQFVTDVDYVDSRFKDNTEAAMANMMLETAIHFEEGAEKYGENNWQKGIPVERYVDSALRHYYKFLRGDTDERHDRAFVWNILCLMWTIMHNGGVI